MAQATQTNRDTSPAPYRKVRLEQPDLKVTHRPDGSILIQPVQPLGPYPERLTERLASAHTPAQRPVELRHPGGERLNHGPSVACPIVGDTVYGHAKPSLPIKRQCLHAARLTLALPGKRKLVTFEAPLPADIEHLFEFLRG